MFTISSTPKVGNWLKKQKQKKQQAFKVRQVKVDTEANYKP